MRPLLFLAAVTMVLGTVVPSVLAVSGETVVVPAKPVDLPALVQKIQKAVGQQFSDVHDNDWFASPVRSVASWGIVSGYLNRDGSPMGVFRPANPVTVAESLKMVLKAADIDETECRRLPVTAGAMMHWAKPYVSCAEQMGMRLFQSTGLDINRPIHRAELLTLVHDAFGDQALPLYAGFKDSEGHRYEADIAYAVSRGMVTGDLDINGNLTGSFRPDANINRAETAKIIVQRLTLQIKDPPTP